MAKTVPSNMRIKGKLGELVYIDSGTYGHHVRKAPKKGSKKEEPAFKEQINRTKFLNQLAAEINLAIDRYHSAFKQSDFYVRLQKCFRKEPLDIRFLLLNRLKGLEVNDNYPMQKLGACKYAVTTTPQKVIITLSTKHQPPTKVGRYGTDSYYNSLMLLCWNKPKGSATVFQNRTRWVDIDKEKPEFEFVFDKPRGTTHWLLFHRQRLGRYGAEIPTMKGEGMWVADVGSFDNIELAMLEKVKMEREAAKKREDDMEKKRFDEEDEEGWVGVKGEEG